MPGSNLTNINSQNFTPFFFLNVSTAVTVSNTNTAAFDALPTIDLSHNKSAINNTIVILTFPSIADGNTDMIIDGTSTNVSLDLYMLQEFQQLSSDGTVMYNYPKWMKVQTITATANNVTFVKDLLATKYKLVPTSANAGVTCNVSYLDELKPMNVGYVPYEYGSEHSNINFRPDVYSPITSDNVVLPESTSTP